MSRRSLQACQCFLKIILLYKKAIRDITNGLHVDFFFTFCCTYFTIALSALICALNNTESETCNTDLFPPFPILLVPYHARPNFLFIRSIYAGTGCWWNWFAGRRISHVKSLDKCHNDSKSLQNNKISTREEL